MQHAYTMDKKEKSYYLFSENGVVTAVRGVRIKTVMRTTSEGRKFDWQPVVAPKSDKFIMFSPLNLFYEAKQGNKESARIHDEKIAELGMLGYRHPWTQLGNNFLDNQEDQSKFIEQQLLDI